MLRRTPLYDTYSVYEGVKLIDFGGWELPVNYRDGIIHEHETVRNSVGMFDVSHMGECLIEGEGAKEYINRIVTNDIARISPGHVIYTMMCYENGTVVDDLLIYCIRDDAWMIVMNASNIEKDVEWITRGNPYASELPGFTHLSDITGQIAVQGPEAARYVSKYIPSASDIPTFGFVTDAVISGVRCLVSRTGYTGEDGFEIYCGASDTPAVWNAFIDDGVAPCGLGARDTLRMEAKLPLYGHELSDTITPLEANLGVFVALDKDEFVGKDALVSQKENGVPRTLRGFEMVDRSVPRNGYEVFRDGRKVGYVTSGSKSPTCGIFCGYLLIERNPPMKFGDELDIEIHGKMKKARLVRTPFYKRVPAKT